MTNNNRNEYVAQETSQVQGLDNVMQKLKEEVAAEIGLVNYEQMDKGALSSRQNGYVGGNITKKLVQLGQQAITQNDSQIKNIQSTVEVSPEVRQLNKLASQNFEQYSQLMQNAQNTQDLQ